VSGTPQGGVISPLLANVYLHRLDRAWQTRGAAGVLVRYADDLVVMCRTRGEAERALAALRSMLVELGLEPKEAKTRIVQLREGGEGLTSSASSTAGCVSVVSGTATSPSSRAGPHAGPGSMLATASVNSRRGSDCCCRSRPSPET